LDYLRFFAFNDIAKARELAFQAVILSQEAGDKALESDALALVGMGYNLVGDTTTALDILQRAEELAILSGNLAGQSNVYGRISSILWGLGDFDAALEYSLKGQQLIAGTPYVESIDNGWNLFLLATYYYDLKDFQQALMYFNKVLAIFQTHEVSIGIARAYAGLATVYESTNRFYEALEYAYLSADLSKEEKNDFSLSRAYNDLGRIYKSLQSYDKASEYYQKSLALRKQIDSKQAIVTTLTEIGDLYLITGKPQNAVETLHQARTIAENIGARAKLFRIHQLLCESYKLLDQYEEALFHHEEFYRYKVETMGTESDSKIKNLKTRFEVELERIKNNELKAAYQEIEEKNKSITASINYAKRIQEAMLPQSETIKASIPYHFIFFKPRDIVSGDFYWFYQAEHYSFLAVADCTGHGVPGAFMSLIGNNLLNDIIIAKKIYQPNEILTELNIGVRNALKQDENDTRDGMDIALVRIDSTQKTMDYAGAMNPLYYVPLGNETLLQIKADKQAIGGKQAQKHYTYSLHTIQIERPTMFYLCSDGYQDQFGGEQNRKFMLSHFRELLYNIHKESMEKQKAILEDTFLKWKKNHKQTDDVLVCGFYLK